MKKIQAKSDPHVDPAKKEFWENTESKNSRPFRRISRKEILSGSFKPANALKSKYISHVEERFE